MLAEHFARYSGHASPEITKSLRISAETVKDHRLPPTFDHADS
jgi:hypothetical protein